MKQYNLFKTSATIFIALCALVIASCSDDNRSNPQLTELQDFTLNTPAYANL